MNDISPEQLLSQIRSLSKTLHAPLPTPEATPATTDFGQMLKSSLDSVNEAQQHARGLKVDFENGTTDASLAEVMIASQKASLSFQAMTQVRNKLLEAYKEVMNMPV